jgi:membrane-associated phospholipid phosphatase
VRARAFVVPALAASWLALAPRAALAKTPTPIDGLGDDVVDAFSTTNVFLFAGAVLTTGAMAQSGVDHSVRVAVQTHLASPAYGDAAFYSGYVLPAVTAPAIWIVGLAAHDDAAAGAGSAAIQALAVALATTGLLKWSTGRAYPTNGGDPAAPDRLDHPAFARTFTPFQGPLLAWPSGHTSATVSIVAALTAYAPEHLAVPLVGYPVAAAIGFGMVVGDRHWTSDVLAGALIGQAIGWSIGSSFRARARGDAPPRLQLGPTGPSTLGLSGTF